MRHIDFIFLRSNAFLPDDTIKRGMERKENKGLRKRKSLLNKVTLHLATSRRNVCLTVEQRSPIEFRNRLGWVQT